MTRLHYPREFRQQSPAVSGGKKNPRVLTRTDTHKRWRVDSITEPSINIQKIINATGERRKRGPGPQRRAARVRSGYSNGRINELHLARQLASPNIRARPRNRPFYSKLLQT